MPVPSLLRSMFLHLADAVCDHRPCPVPDHHGLQNCKIISHRGSYDNRKILENTLAAFDRAAGAGVWGLEMDIRWTRDRVPVICHDHHLKRLHGRGEAVAALTRKELQKYCPSIPSLAEVVSSYGRKVHLMIEIKQQAWPAPETQEKGLLKALQPLDPIRDYHLLTLNPAVLSGYRRFPPKVRVAVTEGWPGPASRWVRGRDWGGFCSHYLLLGKTTIQRHHQRQQQVGTGFPGSLNCLFRELNRGVDWIFSNHAERLQQTLNAIRTAGAHQ